MKEIPQPPISNESLSPMQREIAQMIAEREVRASNRWKRDLQDVAIAAGLGTITLITVINIAQGIVNSPK